MGRHSKYTDRRHKVRDPLYNPGANLDRTLPGSLKLDASLDKLFTKKKTKKIHPYRSNYPTAYK